MTLDFTAIDFETANEQRASVCAIGLVKVRGGVIVDRRAWHINPPTGDKFTNSHIHGITAADVTNAPSWAQTVMLLDAWIEDHPLVAYNSPFDKSVYSAAMREAGMEVRDYVWRCALALTKSRIESSAYKLPQIARHLGIGDIDHHNAGADAEACAKVTLALAQQVGARTVQELWSTVTPRRVKQYAASTALPKPNPDADPNHILYGASITFSGDLPGMSRSEAQHAAAHHGAIVTSTPTKKTQLIVLGGFDPTTFRAGASVSAKVQKAMDLRASGQNIEILTADDFNACLEYDPSPDL